MTAQAEPVLSQALPRELGACVVDPAPPAPGVLTQFLGGTSLRQYLSSKPPTCVCTLHPDTTVAQALKLLGTHDILSAPVVGSDGFVGFLDLKDVLSELLRLTNVWQLTPENRAGELRAAGLRLGQETLRELPLTSGDGKLVYKDNDDASLLEVVEKGFVIPRTTGQACHRLAVFSLRGGGDLEDWMAVDSGEEVMRQLQVTNIISQSDVLKYLYTHAPNTQQTVSTTVEDLGLASKVVMSVPAGMPAINAFAAMSAQKVSSVGIVRHDNEGELVGNLSLSDLRRLRSDEFELLALPVLRFLECIHHMHTSAKGAKSNAWGLRGAEDSVPVDVMTCRADQSLETVIRGLIDRRMHRVYVVDDRNRPRGILTISDVLRTVVERNL